MKNLSVSILASIGLMATASALATDMPPVGKTKCGACHAIDKKMVGPAWKDVAKKYKGDPNAASKIAANIAKGGEFGWKMSKMPPKGMGASDADIKTLSEFIAGLQ